MAKLVDFEDPWGYRSKGEKTHPGHTCTVMQNFTPIGATVAKISVTGHSKKQQKRNDTLPHSAALHMAGIMLYKLDAGM